MPLILASKSPFRARMLENAGVRFQTDAASIDERAIELPLQEADLSPVDISEMLAIAKAENISAKHPSFIIIGCDQILSLDDEILHKVKDMEGARRRLLKLSGKTHHLHSAVCLVKDGEIIWSHVERAAISFRELSPEFIGRHLAEVGKDILSSVGVYQIEGAGIQLVDKLEGDFFSIIGLPVLPLLKELRRLGELER